MCVSLFMLLVLWRHNTDVNNDTHIGTSHVILAKHRMW